MLAAVVVDFVLHDTMGVVVATGERMEEGDILHSGQVETQYVQLRLPH